MDRRVFVKSSALALVTRGVEPQLPLAGMAFGMDLKQVPKGKTLICLFQRGAADGLNVLVPHAEPAYYALRPTIAIPRPGAPNGVIDLDGFFDYIPHLRRSRRYGIKSCWLRSTRSGVRARRDPISMRKTTWKAVPRT